MTLDNVWVVAIAIAAFVGGFALGFAVLLFTPSLYRRLRYGKKHFCKLCCYFTSWANRPESTVNITSKPKPQAARYYTEIDEESIPHNLPTRTAKVRLSYDDVITIKNEHRYSDIDTKGEKYEDVIPYIQTPVTRPPEQQPIYYILEPITYKRLPVKLYNSSDDQVESNVYFILEPDSNNVKPTFEKPQRNTTNTYFVLEPESLVDEKFDAEAYAISDLDSRHSYFILEKSY